jgi:hypothetical protein
MDISACSKIMGLCGGTKVPEPVDPYVEGGDGEEDSCVFAGAECSNQCTANAKQANSISRWRAMLNQQKGWTYDSMSPYMADTFVKLFEQCHAAMETVWQEEKSKGACEFSLEGSKLARVKSRVTGPLVSKRASQTFTGEAPKVSTAVKRKRSSSAGSRAPDFAGVNGPGRPSKVKPGLSLSEAQQQQTKVQQEKRDAKRKQAAANNHDGQKGKHPKTEKK